MKVSVPKILKKKSRIKVDGRFLQTGRIKCTTTPRLSLKEIIRNEKQIQYQVESNADDTRYIVKCSGKGTSKKMVAQGDKKSVSPQKTGNIAGGSGPVDLKSTLALRGKTKTKAGDSQSLKLVIYNDTKPGKTESTHKQQAYQAKIFLSATNLCREALAIDHPLSRPLAQRKLSIMTIPAAGKSQTKMVSVPLSAELAKGNYYWHVMIDSTDRVREIREDNNLYCLSQAVGGPLAITTCDGFVPTIRGDNGNNVIRGTSGPDIIHGLGGNDIIYGLDGNDIICGGTGHDLIHGGLGHDRLFGNSSIWTSHTANCYSQWRADTANHDRLLGGPGNDTLDGGSGHDCVFGENGDDTIIGAVGTNYLIGGKGNDIYRFTSKFSGTARIIEAPNEGTDTLDFSDFPSRNGITVSLNIAHVKQKVSHDPELTIQLSSENGIENLIGTKHDD